MTEKEIKENFSHNLLTLRKAKNLTQSKLAEALNYSDKAVSKWEVGAVLPDVQTMIKIAEYFNVKLNDLIYAKKKNIDRQFKLKNLIVTGLSVCAVWLFATIIYFLLNSTTNLDRTNLVFVVAVPVMFIVLIVFTAIWSRRIWLFVSISGLMWGIIGLIASLINIHTYWFIFVVGVVAQVLIVLWYFLTRVTVKKVV